MNFRFIDSYKFMILSLDKLVSYLVKLVITKGMLKVQISYTSIQLQILKRKGVFPYDYVSSFSSLKEEQLPIREQFYSTSSDTTISIKDFQHTEKVRDTFIVKNLGEYSDIYLKTDVFLLADVFENFRTKYIEAYELNPEHYYTTPGLT